MIPYQSLVIVFLCRFTHVLCAYTTCADIMSSLPYNSASDGVYSITNGTSNLDVYCSFDYTRNYSWTLFESVNMITMQLTFRLYPFTDDVAVNINDVATYRNFRYRLSRDWMRSIQHRSNYLYATCNFNTLFDSNDYLLIDLINFGYDITASYFLNQCVNVESINIRGYECTGGTTISIMQFIATHLYVNGNSTDCDCDIISTDSVGYEENFGAYWNANSLFSCTTDSFATTNWWFGDKVTQFTYTPTTLPTAMPTDYPTANPSIIPSRYPSETPTKIPSNAYDPTSNPSLVPSDSPSQVPIMTPTEYSSTNEFNETSGNVNTQFFSTFGSSLVSSKEFVNSTNVHVVGTTRKGQIVETDDEKDKENFGQEFLIIIIISLSAMVIILIVAVFCVVSYFINKTKKKQDKSSNSHSQTELQDVESHKLPATQLVAVKSESAAHLASNTGNNTNINMSKHTNSIEKKHGGAEASESRSSELLYGGGNVSSPSPDGIMTPYDNRKVGVYDHEKNNMFTAGLGITAAIAQASDTEGSGYDEVDITPTAPNTGEFDTGTGDIDVGVDHEGRRANVNTDMVIEGASTFETGK